MAADLLHAEYFCSERIQCAVKREMTGSLHLAGLHNLAAYDFSHIAVQEDFSILAFIFFYQIFLYIHNKEINLRQLANSSVGVFHRFLILISFLFICINIIPFLGDNILFPPLKH